MATAFKTTAAEEAPKDTVVNTAPHDWDVSRPEIYAEDRWQPIFAEMRREAPINKIVDSGYGDYWNITTAKPIQHIEALPDLFSSEATGITLVGKEAQDLPEDQVVEMPMFIAMDRPKHTEQRRVVAPAFTPSEMTRLTDDVRGRTAEILDNLPLGQSFDWVDQVSIELTTQMLALLFDFPWEDRRKLTFWSDWAGNVEAMRTEELRQERLGHMYEMGAYFQKLWNERLEAGEAPDLLSRMIHSEMRDMDPMTFMGNLILLIVGGNDTTRNTMSAYAYGLDQFPDERAKLEQNPDLIPNTVQELIRWQTPLAHMKRTATQDTELFGHQIKEGDRLALWYISANRDESVFEDPDRLIVDRENARRHLAFGYGIHRCVGARLAELQVRILLEEMAKRRLRANVIGEPDRVPACFVHGYRAMDVELSRY
ncbi:cytochrome P450 [Novosphingopyxis sp. YJ-S2-01]|uniref:cytochrome P450 n=1 Tax=Novosphingopyxis sp. YJ-S2-01 TaxID=2794021 RepID=UPI0018DE9DA1|nr:cytochrome P450 [Novosphingopyxis sp. YJ-S2-01]MBH9536417.1 cytochrome P450 [Novosphingopyxis sp. YJ-S2-01]